MHPMPTPSLDLEASKYKFQHSLFGSTSSNLEQSYYGTWVKCKILECKLD
jgi:hypothetical protein